MGSGSCCGGPTWWRRPRNRCCCYCGSWPPRCCGASRARPRVSPSGRRGARVGGEASAAVSFVVGLRQTFPRAPTGGLRGRGGREGGGSGTLWGGGGGPGSRGGGKDAHVDETGRDEDRRLDASSPPPLPLLPKLSRLGPLCCKVGAQVKEASPPLRTCPPEGSSGKRVHLHKERQKSSSPVSTPVLPPCRGREFSGVWRVGCRSSNSWQWWGVGGTKASFPPSSSFLRRGGGEAGAVVALRREEPFGPAGGSGGQGLARVGVRMPGLGPAPRALPELELGFPVPAERWPPR